MKNARFRKVFRTGTTLKEAWRATIGVIIDRGHYAQAIRAVDRVGSFPIEGAV